MLYFQIYIYLFYFQAKKKNPKKKFVTEQNNGRQAQHQTHGKPNRLQRKQTHSSQKKNKKKKKNQYRVDQYIRNLKSAHQKSLKLKQT